MHLKSLIRFTVFVLFITYSIKLFSQIPEGALTEPSTQEQKKYLFLLCYSDLMQESAYMSYKDYWDIINGLNRIFVIDTLESTGIKEVIFLKVSFRKKDTIQSFYDELEKKGNFFAKKQYLTGSEFFV